MQISRDFRIGFYASIIGGMVLLWVLQPMLTFGWSLLLRFGGGMFGHIIDAQYSNAAIGNRNWVVATIALFGITIVASIILGLFVMSLIPSEVLRRYRERQKVRALAHATRARVYRAIVTGLTLFCLLNIAAGIFLDLQLNASFDQRLAVLASVVPDSTIRILRADWARMKTRRDYVAINDHINNLAVEHEVVLPQIPVP
jgi:hypothetical protein